jgi:hypothetical protein
MDMQTHISNNSSSSNPMMMRTLSECLSLLYIMMPNISIKGRKAAYEAVSSPPA